MAACLLATLVLGPTLDSFVCNEEAGPPAANAILHAADVAASSDDAHRDDPNDRGAGVCVHGHCHHGLTMAALVTSATLAPAPASEPHALALESVHISRLPSGLERPPRA